MRVYECTCWRNVLHKAARACMWTSRSMGSHGRVPAENGLHPYLFTGGQQMRRSGGDVARGGGGGGMYPAQ